jgi:hypothetical protein
LAGKAEKRKKRPVVTPSPKIPAPKRIPGGRPVQPKYEKPKQPEGTTGPAPSEIEPPKAKPGKGPDRSLSGHWIELGEKTEKKEEKKAPTKPQFSPKKIAGILAVFMAIGFTAGVLQRLGVFGGGGGGGTGDYDGTYNGTVTTVAPNMPTTNLSGTFTVVNGYVSDPYGNFTGTVDADGYFTGTTVISPGSPPMTMTGQFSLTGNFTIYGSYGSASQTVVAHKV